MTCLAHDGTSRRNQLIVAAVCIAGVAADARSAHACTAPSCWPDEFVPYEGSLPANAAGIVWRPGRHYGRDGGARQTNTTSPEELRLECTNEDGVAREVPFHAAGDGTVRALLFDEALVVGDECEITPRSAPCLLGEGDPRYSGVASFTVTAAAPIPTSLGTLEAKVRTSHQRVPVPTSDGSCFDEPFACTAQLVLRLSAEAQPWKDALDFETLADDDPWLYPPFPGVYGAPPEPERGTDIVFVANEGTASHGLDAGKHAIAMQAKLAGIDEVIRANEVTLDLTCKGPPPDDGDQPSSDGGGGCSAAGQRPASRTSLGLMLLLLAVFSSRRRSVVTVRSREH
jgi:hypothetical protein